MGRTARKRTGRVVLLMVPGEEKKFESSGKRSAAVVTALRDRRGLRLRTDLSKRLVPRRVQPSWPRRVDKRLSIDAWRSSQVGGQVKRKLVDPARAAAKQDRSWRLSEKQLATVRERNWTGPVQYKARLADGWRRGCQHLSGRAVRLLVHRRRDRTEVCVRPELPSTPPCGSPALVRRSGGRTQAVACRCSGQAPVDCVR